MKPKISRQFQLLSIALVVFFACSRETTWVTTRSPYALNYYQTGLSHLYFAEYIEARQQFQKAVQADPLFRMGYCRLSMTDYLLGDLEKAFDHNFMATQNILKITAEEQDFIDWWHAGLHQDSFAARACLERLNQKMPYNREVALLLASNLCRHELTSTAAEIYYEILALDENYVPALVGLGQLYFQIEKLDSAQFWLEKAVQAAPGKAMACLELGQFYRATGRYENARKMLEKACSLAPTLPESYFQMALLNKELGKYRAALGYFQKYQQQPIGAGPCSIARSLEAEILYAMHQLPDARKKSLEAIELDANNLQAYYWLGQTELAENRFDEAYSLANQMKLLTTANPSIQPSNAAWYYRFQSQVYLQQSQWDAALAEAMEALAGAPAFGELDFRLITARILNNSGNSTGALEVCEEVFKKNPDYPPAHLLFAEICEQAGNNELAGKHYETWLKLYQNADDILPIQKGRTRLAILKKTYPTVRLTRFAEE